MPCIETIDYTLYPDDNALIASVKGEVTFADMKSYLKNVLANPNFVPGMNSLYDLTACRTIHGDLGSLMSFCNLLNDTDDVKDECRTAIVIPNNNESLFRLVRGLVLMTASSSIEHRYFLESHKFLAYQYVGFDPEVIVNYA